MLLRMNHRLLPKRIMFETLLGATNKNFEETELQGREMEQQRGETSKQLVYLATRGP